MIWHLLTFSLLLLSALLFPWWGVLIIAVLYAYRYPDYRLFLAALLVDGYYGAFYSLPLLSIGALLLLILLSLLRPLLLVYTEDHAVSPSLAPDIRR